MHCDLTTCFSIESAWFQLQNLAFNFNLRLYTMVHKLKARAWPTPKMILKWTQPENTPLHRVPAQTMLVFFLGCMYCVMAPIFLPICALFFSLFYLFFKHNLVYHYMQPYASGQTLWPWQGDSSEQALGLHESLMSSHLEGVCLCVCIQKISWHTIESLRTEYEGESCVHVRSRIECLS